MRRFFITAIVAVLAFAAVNAQLLYRISGDGLSKPSYLIGTHHFANASFIDKIPGAKEAFAETSQVYGEIKWDDMMNPDSLQMMMEKEKLPDGKTLKDVLTAEQFSKLDAYLKRTMGVGFENPMVAAQMGTLTPSALQTRLTLIMYMQDHTVDFDPTNSFDLYFQSQAQKSNKPTGGLETMSFQTTLLLQGYSMERQIELLSCLLDNIDANLKLLNDMTTAFYAQDLEALKNVMDRQMDGVCDATPEENAALIYNRNIDWVGKMKTIMSSASTFFAVGAGHLPGEKGLIALLRNVGYKVEGVK